MPWILAHNFITASALYRFYPKGSETYIEAVKKIRDSNKKLISRASADLHGHLSGVDKEKYHHAGMVYLGNNGPDWFYFPAFKTGSDEEDDCSKLADLGHWNKTSTLPIIALMELKRKIKARSLTKAQINELAFWLGYMSHISGDVAVHPFMSALVGAYHDLDRIFLPSRTTALVRGGIVISDTQPPFNFHAIVEHYQDAYIGYTRFREDPFYIKKIDSTCFQRAGIYALKKNPGFSCTHKAIDFYNMGRYFTHQHGDHLQKWVSDYFLNRLRNGVESFDNYTDDVVVSQGMLAEGLHRYVIPDTYNRYISDAISLTKIWWQEAMDFLTHGPAGTDTNDTVIQARELYAAKRYFPTYSRHWNLDTGFGPEVMQLPDNKTITFSPKDNKGNRVLKKLIVAFGLKLKNHIDELR
jgi:hypothetical protein